MKTNHTKEVEPNCTHAHCRCMNLDGLCPNNHYADCKKKANANHTKDEQSEVRGVEEFVEEMIENIVTQMHLWQENERTVREFSENIREELTQTLQHLQEQHEAEKRELVEEILSKKQYLVNQDAYKAEGVFKKDIRAVAQRHGLSTKE